MRSEVITAQSGFTGEVILLLKLCLEDRRQCVFYMYAVGDRADLFSDLGGFVLQTKVSCKADEYFFLLEG